MKPAPLVLLTLTLLLGGCQMFKKGTITAPGVSVVGVPDAGKPATLATSEAGTVIPLPTGSRVTVTKESPVAATPETKAIPAKETTVIEPNGPTEYHKTESTIKADTGTVDTSIAAKRIEAQENRILLYGAMAMVVAAGVFFWLHYPSPALMCAGGAVILFLAWKVSGLPDWFWALAVAAGAGGVALYFGHKRGLYEPVPTDKPPTIPPSP